MDLGPGTDARKEKDVLKHFQWAQFTEPGFETVRTPGTNMGEYKI